MSTYDERQEARRERLAAAAIKARSEADALSAKARTMAEAIPFGQPMLTDHYSYGRDRRYRDRIGKTMDRAVEQDRRADRLAERADSVGSGGIASDDENAVAKLDARIALERNERTTEAKRANKIIRRLRAKGATTAEVAAALVAELGWSERIAAEIAAPAFGAPDGGVPGFTLSNRSANIRRLKQRREQLAGHDVTAELSWSGAGWSIVTDDGRLVLTFEERCSDEVRQTVRRAGFVWAPSRKAFVRKDTPNARKIVPWFTAQLDKKGE